MSVHTAENADGDTAAERSAPDRSSTTEIMPSCLTWVNREEARQLLSRNLLLHSRETSVTVRPADYRPTFVDHLGLPRHVEDGMPSQATLKRLFAESGNVCAFPGCETRLIDSQTGIVVGEVCHIKAREAAGPRYDPDQPESEREGYGNLILLCSVHHKIVDGDLDTYTVELLSRMKEEHRERQIEPEEVDPGLVRRLALNVQPTIVEGSVITTVNQSGGQVAHVIQNFGPPSRVLSPEQRSEVIGRLAQAEPSRIGFASTAGDLEAHQFKAQLMEVFQEAGWRVMDLETFMFFGSKQGLVVTIPFGAPEVGIPQVVAHSLAATGNPVSVNRGDMANSCGVYLQVWHAPT